MMKSMRSEKGLLSLEASIAVTIFLFLMLFMYSFFSVFEARNELAHVLLQTTNSLSLDLYEQNTLGNSATLAELFEALYGVLNSSNGGFYSARHWGQIVNGQAGNTWNGNITVPDASGPDTDEYGGVSVDSSLLAETVKDRFVAYLAGGDTDEAERILKRYHIVGGLDGIDFSGTCVKGSDIYVKISYTLEYEYHVFNLGTMRFEQSACSRLWK